MDPWQHLWGRGVQHHLQLGEPGCGIPGSTLARHKPKDKGQALQPDLIKTMGRFSLSELLILLASLSLSSELGSGRRGLTYWAPAEIWPLVYELETLRKSEKGIQCWRRKQSQRFRGCRQRRKGAFLGPCLFFNLVVYSLDCAVWWVFIGGQVAFNIKRL